MGQIRRRSLLGLPGLLVGEMPHHHTPGPSAMTAAANAFLAALDAEQRARATFAFDDDQRMDWHYVPRERKGLPLREMAPHQRHLAGALLASGLSQAGYIKAVTIMSLEDVLRILERDSGERRNPEKFYFSIFGTPSDSGTWGWRVEGHHLSQNYTVTDGQVVDAPSFFGANPAEVRSGPRQGLRVLAAEEDLAYALLRELGGPLRKAAVVESRAYGDILTAASRKAALEGQPSGLAAEKLNPSQFEALHALAELYARNLPDGLVQRRLQQIDQAGRNVWFAWAGGTAPGEAHYYRVQTSAFLIELDNTQNGGNHIHSVWRDFRNDFGADLLKAHYQAGHR